MLWHFDTPIFAKDTTFETGNGRESNPQRYGEGDYRERILRAAFAEPIITHGTRFNLLRIVITVELTPCPDRRHSHDERGNWVELHAFGFQQICWVMLSTCTLILTLAFTTVVSDCGPLLRRQVPPQDMGSGVTGSLSASQDVRQAVGQVGQVPGSVNLIWPLLIV